MLSAEEHVAVGAEAPLQSDPPKHARPTLRILASPARRNAARNPYNRQLSDHLVEEGCVVDEFDNLSAFTRSCDVVHLHWPHTPAQGVWLRALVAVFMAVARIGVQRLRGADFVWTAHNLGAHDQNNPGLERTLMWFMTRMLTGVIFLTHSSREEACRRMPALRTKPWTVTPHSLYGDAYATKKSKEDSRAAFGLPRDGHVIGFVGDALPYKGLENLLDAFGEEKLPSTLLVASRLFGPGGFQRDIRDRIARLQSDGRHVVFIERRLDNDEMTMAIRASDVLALPYRGITNSGLATLVLEQEGRIVASDAPFFRELLDEVGQARVAIVEGDWTAASLKDGLYRLEHAPAGDDALEAFRAARRWPAIAARTRAFYDGLRNR